MTDQEKQQSEQQSKTNRLIGKVGVAIIATVLIAVLVNVLYLGKEEIETINIPQDEPAQPQQPEKEPSIAILTLSNHRQTKPSISLDDDRIYSFEDAIAIPASLTGRMSRPALSPETMLLKSGQELQIKNELRNPEMLLFYKQTGDYDSLNVDYTGDTIKGRRTELAHRVHLKPGEKETLTLENGQYLVKCLLQSCTNSMTIRVADISVFSAK